MAKLRLAMCMCFTDDVFLPWFLPMKFYQKRFSLPEDINLSAALQSLVHFLSFSAPVPREPREGGLDLLSIHRVIRRISHGPSLQKWRALLLHDRQS